MTAPVATDHITDEYMNTRINQAKPYSLVVLKPTRRYMVDDSQPIIWEHGRRNMALQAAGVMPIVCPVGDDTIAGIAILDTDPDEAQAILAGDPGVRSGIFTVEVHACRVFPGDAIPR